MAVATVVHKRVGLAVADNLLRLVVRLRGNRPFIPRGVCRFRSFEEADRWSLAMMARRDSAVADGASLESMVSGAARTRKVPDVSAIRALLDGIVARWHPLQVWLFGSRARGDAKPDSDWDLFVVVDDSVGDVDLDPGVGRRLRRACGVHADVIPWRVSEFEEFRVTPNTLAYEVANDGVLLHER